MKTYTRKWNPPHVIARRLLAYPFLMVVRALAFVVVFVGWGYDDARRAWDDLS